MIMGLLLLFCVFSFLMERQNDNIVSDEYFVINEDLHIGDRTYAKCDWHYFPIALTKQIGKTEYGQQVFGIKKENSKDFICVRSSNGEENLYYNIDLSMKSISEIENKSISISDLNSLESGEVIEDRTLIDKLLEEMIDENLVSGNIEAEEIRQILCYPKEHEGLAYDLIYIFDGTYAFLYDDNSGDVWELDDHYLEEFF